MHCNNSYTQIEQDLSRFQNYSINFDDLGQVIINKYNMKYTQSLCNYVILNNNVRVLKKYYTNNLSTKSFVT